MLRRNRDPRQGRFLTLASLRWVIGRRAWTPYYVRRYLRFLWFKLRHPHVVTEGLVFLGKRVEVSARRGYGRVILGKWVHIGDHSRLRAHEGTLRVGDKCVFGRDDTITCFLDIEFGAGTLVADWVYVSDFDHRFADIHIPIKDQGISKSPVRIGPDVWIGVKASLLRGVTVGPGSVVAAHSVVTRDVPAYSVVAGAPARVVHNRVDDYLAAAEKEALAQDAAGAAGRTLEAT